MDVSTFITVVEKGWGLNPERDMKKTNMDENMETILTMFNQSQADPMAVDEVIEDFTQKLLDRNGVQQIADYFLDHTMSFKRILYVDVEKMMAQLNAQE